VSAASYNPMPESSRRRGDVKHPVLARLPDVSGQQSTAHCAERDSEPLEYVDYRFDAPAGTEDQAAPIRRMTRPHAFERTSHDGRLRSPRRASYVQPDSDPFSLPTTSMYDRLAPVARFLVLFALFTAVGTAFLMKGGFAKHSDRSTQRPAIAPPTPAAKTFRQTLEPAGEEFKSTAAGPTANGPRASQATEANVRANVEDLFAEIDKRPATVAKQAAPNSPEPALADANANSLPRVQTTDPQLAEIVLNVAENGPAHAEEPSGPPVVARLPGIILEAPPRQAQHVDNQSGLH
jgi:hypothetical protein